MACNRTPRICRLFLFYYFIISWNNCTAFHWNKTTPEYAGFNARQKNPMQQTNETTAPRYTSYSISAHRNADKSTPVYQLLDSCTQECRQKHPGRAVTRFLPTGMQQRFAQLILVSCNSKPRAIVVVFGILWWDFTAQQDSWLCRVGGHLWRPTWKFVPDAGRDGSFSWASTLYSTDTVSDPGRIVAALRSCTRL